MPPVIIKKPEEPKKRLASPIKVIEKIIKKEAPVVALESLPVVKIDPKTGKPKPETKDAVS